jgi:hypothetical protein
MKNWYELMRGDFIETVVAAGGWENPSKPLVMLAASRTVCFVGLYLYDLRNACEIRTEFILLC